MAQVGPYPVYASYTAPGVTTIATTYNGQYGVVASYVGALSADASANVAALYQEKVTINGVQFIYDVSLCCEDTFKLLNAFGVTGWGPLEQPAQFAVSVVDVSGLAEVLQTAILKAALGGATSYDPASAGTVGESGSMNNDLNNEVFKQLMVKIQDDGLIDSVQEQYADTWYSVDASSGAWDTAKHYNGTGALPANARADCNLLFEQIPSDTLNRYMDASEEPLSNALLLAPGDKITFVWDVNTTLKASVLNMEDMKVAAAAAAYNTAGNQAVVGGQLEGAVALDTTGYKSTLSLGIAPVRVAVTITLADDVDCKETVNYKWSNGSSIVTRSGPRFLINHISLGGTATNALRDSNAALSDPRYDYSSAAPTTTTTTV